MESSRGLFLQLITCPICGGSIEALDTGVAVFAKVNAEPSKVGGLQAYRCRRYAHLFFVKAHDLEVFSNCELAPSL